MFRKTILFQAVILLLFSVSLYAGNKPLSLVTSSPATDSTSISTDITVTLEFSNNVVNRSVQEKNSSCITLVDEKGFSVIIEILYPDDQLEPEKKRIIKVKPLEELEQGKTYQLHIDRSLESKNGQQLDQTIIINFTTKA